MAVDRNVYVVGLPESGKTTYLAALWHLLNATSNSLCLNLHRLSGNRSYLNTIVERWRECLPVDRTPRNTHEKMTIELKTVESCQILSLNIPDLSGESFIEAFGSRSLQTLDEEAIHSCTGLLVFVSTNRPIRGSLIESLGPEFTDSEDSGPYESATIPWSPENAQEQVCLVDFLQSSRLTADEYCKLRVAIVISAWDLVIDQDIQPHKWLQRELPLLSQFLRNGRNSFEFEIFGVSAQGAPFDENLSDDFLEKNPNERAVVQHKEKLSNDLSSPLAWLVE